MKQTRRLLWFVLSTVVLCALLGGVYGRRVEATTGDEPDVHTSYDAFAKVYDVVEKNYADPVDADKALFVIIRKDDGDFLFCDKRCRPQRATADQADAFGKSLTRTTNTTQQWVTRHGTGRRIRRLRLLRFWNLDVAPFELSFCNIEGVLTILSGRR